MKRLLLLATAAAAVTVLPAVVLLILLGLAGTAIACAPDVGTGALSPTAPVPAAARAWVAITHMACPALPQAWIAAVMAQESGFRPDAYANDANGGTWGLFQINASIWQQTYGHPWSADLNGNGVWDVKDPQIHAAVAGKYLCARLDGVRRIRAAHPDWPSTRQLSELDALVVAHNAGEARLASYPAIPAITATYIRDVREHMATWSTPGATTPNPQAVGAGCTGAPGTVGTVVVPPGTPLRWPRRGVRPCATSAGPRVGAECATVSSAARGATSPPPNTGAAMTPAG